MVHTASFTRCLRFSVVSLIIMFSFGAAIAAGGGVYGLQNVNKAERPPQTAAEWLKLAREYKGSRATRDQAVEAYRTALRLDPTLEEGHLELASVLRLNGKTDEELSALYAGREVLPDSLELARNLWSALSRKERYADVVKDTTEYLSLHPRDSSALGELGFALVKLKRFEEAVEPLVTAIQIDPRDGTALHDLAFAYSELHRDKEALDTYRRILEELPDYDQRDSVWRNTIGILEGTGRFDEALALVEKESLDDPAKALIMRCSIRNFQGRYEDAAADCRKAEEIGCPDDLETELYLNLGVAYTHTSRLTEAVDAYRHAVDADPDDYNGLVALASAYALLERCDEAMQVFEKAIRVKPTGDLVVYNNVSVCLMKAGRLNEAEKGLRYAIALDRDNAVPRMSLAGVLMMQKRYGDAESELRVCIRLGMTDGRVFMALGQALSANKKRAEAVQVFRQALKLRPHDHVIMNTLGYTLAETNESLDEALDLTKRAVRASPHEAAFRDSLGWTYFKLGKLDEAERELKEATERRPNAPVPIEHLGDVYEKRGKVAQARTLWKKALSLAGDNDEMKARLTAKLQGNDAPKQGK